MLDEKVKKQIDGLPKTAGVYLFYPVRNSPPKGSSGARKRAEEISNGVNGKKQAPIYIGKAINIKERVKNHFMQPSYRDNLFIQKVSRIEFINTNSEIEALVLEANLIKKHLPRFNVVWKDDKNYFFVAFGNRRLTQTGTQTNADTLPCVFITHQKNDPRAKYIGPFIEGAPLKKTLKYLRRVFPFYATTRHPKNACTWCQLGLCPGPAPDLPEYKKNLKKLTLILQGKRKTVLYALRREMEALAKTNKFEEAGKVRDKMLALERILEHTHIIANDEGQMANGGWKKTQVILQNLLGYKNKIYKIECYDISNIQGKNAVGSMVVFVEGAPEKSQYKKFSIRVADASDTNLRIAHESTNGKRKRPYELVEDKPNDIAMLKQVLIRRLAHDEWGYPQVMLIDGGIAQLNIGIKTKNLFQSSQELKNKLVEKIKIISIAKGRQELFIEGQKQPIPLKNLPQEIYNLIKHLDDEAHRFAISYHRKLRKKFLLI